MIERVPYRATDLAASYDAIRTLPVQVLLDNVRSAYELLRKYRALLNISHLQPGP